MFGLILLTNDGAIANLICHPRYRIQKVYQVAVKGRVTREQIAKIEAGVWLAEGKTSGARIRIERRGRDRTYMKVTIREGKNREIRRVFAKLGNPVLTLKRVRIGGLSLHGLKPGKHRFLKPEEIQSLRSLAREDLD